MRAADGTSRATGVTAFPGNRVVEEVTSTGAGRCLAKDDPAEAMLSAIRVAAAAA